MSVRPYLVIPKLIEQPTWGGTYIVETKQWQEKPAFAGKKIGQSYELYDKSNLSLLTDSSDPAFSGEMTDSKEVTRQSDVPGTLPLSSLIAEDPDGVLGKSVVSRYGATMPLLLKFTQALGNSFQLHIPDGLDHPRWKPKPESWYYFEPGLITCGVRKDADWQAYQNAVTELDRSVRAVAATVEADPSRYEDAKKEIAALVKTYNPWQYVNLVRVEKGTLLDLSPCGIHHSWEEDLETIPLGNVLYEIQLNVMDDAATIRSFDKGKIGADGKLRALQIEDYFALADRSPEANDPATHMRKAKALAQTPGYTQELLLESKYYMMERIAFARAGAAFEQAIDTYRHVFVQSGSVTVTHGETSVSATAGHSVFVPASCGVLRVTSTGSVSEILVSY